MVAIEHRGSMAQRLYRKYLKREQWFLMQAKVRPVVRKRRRSGLGAFLDSMRETQRIIEQHQRSVDEFNRITEQHRLLERTVGRLMSEQILVYVGTST
jgi:hypothetical protein